MTLLHSYYRAPENADFIDEPIGKVLEQRARHNGETVAVTEIGNDGKILRRVTYSDLFCQAHELALRLSTRFEPGQKIALWAPNSFEWVLVEYAVLLAGLALVPINPSSPIGEIEQVAKHSQPVGFFFGENDGKARFPAARMLADRNPNIREVVDIFRPEQLGKPGARPAELPIVKPADPAFIINTSGSTDVPKGVILSHQASLNGCVVYFRAAGASSDFVWGGINPLFHLGGCLDDVLGPLVLGCSLCLFRNPDALMILDKIESEHISGFWSVPAVLSSLLFALRSNPRDVSSLKSINSGGAAIPPELVREICDVFGCTLQRGYGLTEIDVSMTLPDDSEADILTTSGRPFPGTEVSIRDLESHQIVGLNEIGEIWVRNDNVTLGYENDAELTRKAFAKGGWFRTGDLGSMDERGYLTVTGRIKNLIIRGGKNISPEVIENAISQIDGVAGSVVVGIPNKTLGEIVGCFFCSDRSQSLTTKKLTDACIGSLARNEIPAVWIEIKEFPLTGSGKIHRRELLSGYQDGKYQRMKIEL